MPIFVSCYYSANWPITPEVVGRPGGYQLAFAGPGLGCGQGRARARLHPFVIKMVGPEVFVCLFYKHS